MTASMKKDVSDDDLVLLHYGELDGARAAELRAAIASDPALAAREATLARTLARVDAAPLPAPGADLGARMWARVQPKLGAQPAAFAPAHWVPWAALAASLAVVAVGIGFWSVTPTSPVVPAMTTVAASAAFTPAARERVLLTRVAHHLDGSQRLFTSVSNADTELAETRAWAQRVLAANRVYRNAAANAGEKRMVALLDAMEPMLIEIANAPDSISREELAFLQQRIEDADLLFRLRSAQQRFATRANQNPATAVQSAPRSDI